MKKRNFVLIFYLPIHIIFFAVCIHACNKYETDTTEIQNNVHDMSYKYLNRISIVAKLKNSNHEYKFNITSKNLLKEFTSNLYSDSVYNASEYYECSYEITFYTIKTQYAIEYRKAFDIPKNSYDKTYYYYKNDPKFYKYYIPNKIYYDVDYHKRYFFRNNEMIRKITFTRDIISEDLLIPLSKHIDPLIKSKKYYNDTKFIEL